MSIVEYVDGKNFIHRSLKIAPYRCIHRNALKFPKHHAQTYAHNRKNNSLSRRNACSLHSRIKQHTPPFSAPLGVKSPPPPLPPLGKLIHRTQQLGLEYELALLVLLARLVRLVVLPPHRLLALPAHDVPDDVPARRHVAFCGVGLRDVHDGVEEVGFAVLAAEVLLRRSRGEEVSNVPASARILGGTRD